MPAILGQFESSLRGRTSIVNNDPSAKKVLHHCCSGASHGHGVKKEKSVREKERERRNCSLPPESSSDESLTPSPPGGVPDLLLHGRSVSNESNRRASVGSVGSRRSSSEVMKRMLYGSATKDDLKNRCIDEADSGLASSDNENSGKEYKRSKSAENHIDDDEEDMTHLRRQQRQERREYYQRHSPKNNTSRKESPSPAPKKISLKLRRNSADGSERDSSVSPPLTPPRSSTSTPKSQNNCQTLPRRTKSTSSNTLLTPKTERKASGGGYAFGSSTERFSQKQDEDHRASQDNLSDSHNNLHRTTSDPRVLCRVKKSPSHKNSVTKAWLQFQADIEAAMLKKPGMNNGLYKNLTDLMQDRMDQLDQAKSEDQLSHEKAWLEAENVWLVHRDGFAAGRQIKESEAGEPLNEGKVRVKLDYNEEVIEVDEDDVEKANPPSFDRVEDLAQLRYLNESSVLHTLRQRYGNNLIHTYAGPSMITINPCNPLAIYSEKIIQMFKGCKLEDMPPHIYSAGQMAYRTLMSTKKDQSIAFIGRSGSGKSTNFRHVLTYLVHAAGSVNNILPIERLSAISTLLEAFGNTRTIMNANATRFSQIFSVDFDHSGVIASASVQVLMLEKSRVVRRPEGEPNFNIFYQMLAGLDSKQRKEFQLENMSEPNLFMTPLQRSEDKSNAAAAFIKLAQAAEALNINHMEMKALWSVLSAIFHLGCAAVGKSNLGRAGFAKPNSAQKAAHCLGISTEDLSRAIFQGSVSSGTLNRRHKNEATAIPDGLEALEGFVVGLYSEAFSVLLSLINRAIASPAHTAASIIVVDTPGFQNPATCGRPAGATFEELCHNYGQERLQLMFHDKTITALKERYESEQIEVPDLDDLTEICTPQPLIKLIDKQSMARASQSDLNQTDKRGLLWLLDEEAIFPGASDESFVERLMLQYSDRNSEDLIKKGPTENNFILQHFQGTNPVLYNAQGWLKSSRESPYSKTAVQLLHDSADKNMSDLFLKYRSGINTTVSGSIVGVEGSQSLRRASSIRRAFTSGTAGIKRHSAALQVKFQIDGLIEQLRRTRVKFVHCFLPQHTAGLCDVKSPGNSPQTDQVSMNIPLIRSQLRGAQILDAVRLHKIGFPESLGYGEFWRRFSLLSENGFVPNTGEEKSAVEELLVSLDLDHTSYRLGNTQIFLRGGVLSQLEEERYERLGTKVVSLQAYARGYLARKNAQKLKAQDLAIRCIQKNVKKFMGVRGWPWWRLLIKVTPLLNVHRTEEQLRAREDEVEQLKARLEKAERERNEFKEAVDKQESRISELSADLSEEHNAAILAAERLESEQSDRMKLEKEKLELVARNRHLTNNNERIEMELLHSRALEINGGIDSDDDETNGSLYKAKYERAVKELEYTKKRMTQQHEDDLEQLVALKKQLEKKLNDAYEEVDDQRQVVAQWKRKAQKIQGEMNDTRLHLEEQASRNSLLEKKQRKFDSELALVNEDKRQEMLAKEKYQKETDQLKQEKLRLENQVNGLTLDAEFKDDRITSLTRDLEDTQTGEGSTEEEVRNLKRLKLEYEMKLKDQEEELDDLAGQVQMLESNKTKLEMEMIQTRKELRHEIQSREDELEDARNASSKKVKMLEQQLEQEHEERLGFLRERHDFEGKIMNLQDLLERSGDEDQIAKLKRDLKRTKALLRDAQLMIEKAQNEGTNKVLVRQLKNQLEDAEFARTAAMKGRQNAELELADVQIQLEDVSRSKSDLEDKHLRMGREKADIASQLQENEEELHDIMRKYKASVGAVSTDQITIQDQAGTIQELEDERNKLREQLAEMSQRVDCLDADNVSNLQHKRLEMKIRELESKLELELTTRNRMDTQIARLKETIEKLNKEIDDMRLRDQSSQEQQRKIARQLRDLKEDYTTIQGKETELSQKKGDLEKQLEVAEVETMTVKSDLKLAMKRIEDLQVAISGEIDSESYSDHGSESSDEEMHQILDQRQRTLSIHRDRESISRDIRGANRTLSEHDESLDKTARFEGISEGDESQA
eukprot:TRINITY_DN17730_c0_g1_i1.p1 TRINITY_DN17730_c0_g1~~TRINITY_DN17730_c0_g1_i1.p1  ORF type:complete len:2011 (+),score=520.24 TRINITY_DN17730_c0_g1_i1:123-6155(+)